METVLQVKIGDLFLLSIPLIFIFGFLLWLVKNWFIARSEKSIQHEYNKQIEEYKFSLSKKDKIANIASLFSHWIKYRGNEKNWLNEKELIEYYEELTKMSFELALWTDDDVLLKDVMKRLKNEDGSQDITELLLQVKKLINENKNSDLEAGDITIWPADTNFILNEKSHEIPRLKIKEG